MDKAVLRKSIHNKHILLDTGVIIRAFEHLDRFEDFLLFLQESGAEVAQFPFIEFEFIRGAYQIEHREKREEFIKSIAPTELPFGADEITKFAISIANAYSARKLHDPSLVDCCIAAYLKKYAENLFLVTLNHKDFPTFLFDRFFIWPIDTDKEIFPLAFYKFNTEKAKKIGIL